jgi:hypothetical protein
MNEIWYGRYVIGYKLKLVIFNNLHSVISTREWFKFVRCNGDHAIAHDTLRKRIPNQK